MFNPEYPLDQLRPADYNPRSIDDASLAELVESLRTLGIVKPIVALESGLIVAGHQRSRAAKLAGFKLAPVCFLTKTPNPQDEIRFNQLHNGTDLDSGDENARVTPATAPGFAMASVLEGNYRSRGASTRAEVGRLLTAYGNWGGCVADLRGNVLSSASYALAAHTIGMQARTYYVDDGTAPKVKAIFERAYGRYDYSKIERQTFNQTFAQMYRLRRASGSAPKRDNRSPTYEWLLTQVSKTDRILDFGCGQGDYVAALKQMGYNILGLEFFRRDAKTVALDLAAANKMIDTLCLSLRLRGRFDVVICDYVLNSVDSQQAENDVMACVAGFLAPGGRAFFSGRRLERVVAGQNMRKHARAQRECEFLDEKNISALFRGGEWFFQKFHDKSHVDEIVRTYFRDDGEYEMQMKSSAWQASVIRQADKRPPDLEGALRREFDLPLPNGRSFGRHDDILRAMNLYI